MPKTTVPVTAIWLRRTGGERGPAHVEVLAEIDGVWRLACREPLDGTFSHIAEGNGAYRWPPDKDTEPEQEKE